MDLSGELCVRRATALLAPFAKCAETYAEPFGGLTFVGIAGNLCDALTLLFRWHCRSPLLPFSAVKEMRRAVTLRNWLARISTLKTLARKLLLSCNFGLTHKVRQLSRVVGTHENDVTRVQLVTLTTFLIERLYDVVNVSTAEAEHVDDLPYNFLLRQIRVRHLKLKKGLRDLIVR
jgi:hypothetical protein